MADMQCMAAKLDVCLADVSKSAWQASDAQDSGRTQYQPATVPGCFVPA